MFGEHEVRFEEEIAAATEPETKSEENFVAGWEISGNDGVEW